GPGNNMGASLSNGDLLLFLNHDTVVTPDFLVELVDVMKDHPGIGVVQSKIMMATDPKCVDSVGAYLTMSGMWFHPNRGEPDEIRDAEPIKILGAAGACLMVRRKLFEALGGFDPDFFIYFDDADLAWRARLMGSKVVIAPRSVIYHWGGATTQKMPSVFTVYHSFKNRLCSLIKLLCFRDLLIVLPFHLLLCIGGALVYFLRLKPVNAFAILRAWIWNLRHMGETLRKRSAATKGMRGHHRRVYEGLIKPFSLNYLVRASMQYVAKW
ncbi:MAG: glycosyltransferase family 2 protein, partial [Anaerolineales bacterium]